MELNPTGSDAYLRFSRQSANIFELVIKIDIIKWEHNSNQGWHECQGGGVGCNYQLRQQQIKRDNNHETSSWDVIQLQAIMEKWVVIPIRKQ